MAVLEDVHEELDRDQSALQVGARVRNTTALACACKLLQPKSLVFLLEIVDRLQRLRNWRLDRVIKSGFSFKVRDGFVGCPLTRKELEDCEECGQMEEGVP